jgi:hypothetical protein
MVAEDKKGWDGGLLSKDYGKDRAEANTCPKREILTGQLAPVFLAMSTASKPATLQRMLVSGRPLRRCAKLTDLFSRLPSPAP